MIDQSLPREHGNLEKWSRELVDTLTVRLRALTQMKVTQSDSNYDYLSSKLVAGGSITLTVLNPGANEQLQIAAVGALGGTVTQINSGVGTAANPNPITNAGQIDVDINPLTTNAAVATTDLFPYLDVSVGTTPSATRKATFLNLQAAMDLVNLGARAHSSLTGIGIDDHHARDHVLATNAALGATHTISGTSAGQVLRASSSSAANFQALAAADIASGAALTKVDDTNVTLTLGGTPASALLAATSLTLGWAGTLAVARGGGGAGTALGSFNNLSPLTTRGDLLTRDASNNVRIPIGTAAKYLRSDGTDPSWVAATANDDWTQYLKLTGRATTTNDPVISTGATGTIYLSSAAGGGGVIQATTDTNRGLIDLERQVRIHTGAATYASTPNLLEMPLSLSMGSNISFRGLHVSGTVTFTAAPNVISMGNMFNFNPTFVNTGNLAMSPVFTFSNNVLLSPTSASTTTAWGSYSVSMNPTLSTISGGGTATAPAVTGLRAAGGYNTGWMVSDWAAVHMTNPGGSGGTAARVGAMRIDNLNRSGITNPYTIWAQGTMPMCHEGPAIFGTAQSTWTAPTNPTKTILQVMGGFIARRTTFSNAAYTVDNAAGFGDFYLGQTGSLSASRTVTLPAAATVGAGRVLFVKDESNSASGTNKLIVDANASETIDGFATQELRTGRAVLAIICDGTNWQILYTMGTVVGV